MLKLNQASGLQSKPAQAPARFAPRAARSGGRAPTAHPRRHVRAVRLSATKDTSTTPQSMAQAQSRWETQVIDGSVKSVSTSQAGELMRSGWVLVDTRPPTEASKVPIEGAVCVPLFVPDTSNSLGSLLARASAWGTGGWWLGGTHMVANPAFLAQVQSQVPKDAKLVVGCQKGLRSLAACEQLSRAGYSSIAWVNGGFDMAKPGDLPTAGGKDLRYAGIGGISEVLGWTEVQQQAAKEGGFLGGLENVLKLVALVLLVDVGLFAWEYIAFLLGAPAPFSQ